MSDYYEKIKDFLLENQEGASVLEVSSALGLNRNSTARYLESLEHQGIVSCRHIGPAKLYVLAKELPFTVQLDLYKKAMDVASCGISIADVSQPDMPLIYVNKEFEKITGYSADEVVGKNCRFLQGTADNKVQRDIIKDAFKKKISCTVRLVNFTKDGMKFFNVLRLAPIFDSENKLTHYIGIQTVE